MYICVMCMQCLWWPERALDPLGLELQVAKCVMSHLVDLVEVTCRSSWKSSEHF